MAGCDGGCQLHKRLEGQGTSGKAGEELGDGAKGGRGVVRPLRFLCTSKGT